jgi:hypothetical protein
MVDSFDVRSSFERKFIKMLKIQLKNGKEVEWGFNMFFGKNSEEELDFPDQVNCVFADGAELAYIKDYFSSIPMMSTSLVVMWRAPWAQFIVDNIV